jgi:hypothetical protein
VKKINIRVIPKTFKIYPLVHNLNKKFQTLYLPGQNIAIHEYLCYGKADVQ